MKICFGANQYTLIPGSAVQTLGNTLSIQLLADTVNFEELEVVLKNKNNINEITVLNDQELPTQIIFGYSKLDTVHKKYHVLYETETIEHVVTPASVDPETGEAIPAEMGYETIEHYADIFYISLIKPGVEEQVDINTANIEFLAIMSDIELEQ